MRLLALSLLLAATPALAGETPRAQTGSPAACQPDDSLHAIRRSGARQALRRLGDLPPANMERSVWRRIGGCPAPMVVRYGVDARRLPQPDR